MWSRPLQCGLVGVPTMYGSTSCDTCRWRPSSLTGSESTTCPRAPTGAHDPPRGLLPPPSPPTTLGSRRATCPGDPDAPSGLWARHVTGPPHRDWSRSWSQRAVVRCLFDRVGMVVPTLCATLVVRLEHPRCGGSAPLWHMHGRRPPHLVTTSSTEYG